jgi:pimeloyl-ACP methyl ester carboxylesterase
MPRPVVLVHGYSDRGESFAVWKRALEAGGLKTEVCSYETLVNEVLLKDIAEGFERALREQTGLEDGEPFDAIVHSTGMLVLRAWLTTYDARRDRIKHLIGLAPATFGSPLAHKGRSWLGAIFKGRKELGPDFLEAGDQVLDALELASAATWRLAERDMIGDQATYGRSSRTPYAFVFVGNRGYTGLKSLFSEPGTDGTVRWAGCPLNSRKFVLDLTRDPSRPTAIGRAEVAPCCNADVPLHFVDGLDHSTILSKPSQELVDLVVSALAVGSSEQYDAWLRSARARSSAARDKVDQWQQFILRAVDERGDPIHDYHAQLLTGEGARIGPFHADVHAYSSDKSYRAFHVNLTQLGERPRRMKLRLLASAGTQYVGYTGFGSEKLPVEGGPPDPQGKWDAQLDLSAIIGDEKLRFFFPFTTTLIELKLNREPLPLSGENRLMWFLPKRG